MAKLSNYSQVIWKKYKMRFITSLFKHKIPAVVLAAKLLPLIHTQSRQAWFYITGDVKDTVEGRLEVLMLNMFLATKAVKVNNKTLAQALIDQFFDDLDAELREMAVGDLKVPKKIKAIGSSFYGRVESYDKAFNDPSALELAITRNFGQVNAPLITQYCIKNSAFLESQDYKERIDFTNEGFAQ